MSDTDRPLDTLSVAPEAEDAPNAGNQERDPRQDAGQDSSIQRRLERDPEPSSGYDEDAERKLQDDAS